MEDNWKKPIGNRRGLQRVEMGEAMVVEVTGSSRNNQAPQTDCPIVAGYKECGRSSNGGYSEKLSESRKVLDVFGWSTNMKTDGCFWIPDQIRYQRVKSCFVLRMGVTQNEK